MTLKSRRALSLETQRQARKRRSIMGIALTSCVALVGVSVGIVAANASPSRTAHANKPMHVFSLFGTTRPKVLSANTGVSLELGTRFTPKADGAVIGIRFYKAPLNTGVHTGTLWTEDGHKLAEVTFTHESASGWQEAMLSKPQALRQGDHYYVSYHAPHGHFSYTVNYYQKQRSTKYLNGAENNVAHRNGVLRATSHNYFPTLSGGGTNFFVDLDFVPKTTSKPVAVQDPPTTAKPVTSTTTRPAPTPTTTKPVQTTGSWGCTSGGAVGEPNHKRWPSISMSNGYTTYVQTDGFANESGTTENICGNPSNLSLSVNAQNDSDCGGCVQMYPGVQQLTNDTDLGNASSLTFGQTGNVGDLPISRLHSLTSTYSETQPASATSEAAYDIWFSNNKGFEGSTDAMIWVDTTESRGNGGAQVKAHTTIDGHAVTYETFGTEQILQYDTNAPSGTVNILAFVKYLQSIGAVSADASISQLDFGWEICQTPGTQNFKLSNYSLTAS